MKLTTTGISPVAAMKVGPETMTIAISHKRFEASTPNVTESREPTPEQIALTEAWLPPLVGAEDAAANVNARVGQYALHQYAAGCVIATSRSGVPSPDEAELASALVAVLRPKYPQASVWNSASANGQAATPRACMDIRLWPLVLKPSDRPKHQSLTALGGMLKDAAHWLVFGFDAPEPVVSEEKYPRT